MKKYLIIGILAVIIPLIVAVIIIIVQKECELYLNANDTILLFVGILATFVVVSNYAQVKEVERKAEEHKKDLDDKIEKTYYKICSNGGYIYEGLFIYDESYRTIFLFQACDYFLMAIDYCDNEKEIEILKKNINQCIDNIRNNPITKFRDISHKNDCYQIMNNVLSAGYEVSDIIEMVFKAQTK